MMHGQKNIKLTVCCRAK